MANANGMNFTTHDNDNDVNDVENCAHGYRGGWWYRSCHGCNPNGHYASGAVRGYHYMVWTTWRGDTAIKQTVMMIRGVF
jgi:ficolin